MILQFCIYVCTSSLFNLLKLTTASILAHLTWSDKASRMARASVRLPTITAQI